MSHSIDRRQFLHRCTTTALAVGGVGVTARPAASIEPIARNGSPHFKFSLAAYSYRDLLTGTPPEMTLADFIDDCAEMNLEGTELTSYYFPEPTTVEYLHQLKQQCFRLGLSISGTSVGNDFWLPPGEARDEQIAVVKRWVDHAEVLGAPVIRIFAGKEKTDLSPERAYTLMVEGIEECCDYAGRRGVYLALENHGGPTATADGMLAFIRDVQSPWFGVNLDTGNFFGDDTYTELTQIAPYAVNVQIKVVTSDETKEHKKPTDFARLAEILRDAGYRGYIALEYEEDGDPREECPRYVAVIREAFA